MTPPWNDRGLLYVLIVVALVLVILLLVGVTVDVH